MSRDAAPQESRAPERDCVDRTRSAVLNVMVFDGGGVAVSGWVLGRLDVGALLLDTDRFWWTAMASLFAILVLSRVVLRVGAGRAALRDPARRGRRFYVAHVLSALIGGLAVPLGFAYGWLVEPTLAAVAPFWIVALGVGVLALPRTADLDGFDQAMPLPTEKSEART